MDIYYIIINILQCIKKLKSKEMDIYYNMINLIDKRIIPSNYVFRNCSIVINYKIKIIISLEIENGIVKYLYIIYKLQILLKVNSEKEINKEIIEIKENLLCNNN